jgi:signal transduction histidine kinase/CheY-like chemotaxis protein
MLEEDKALSMAAARAATWRLEERELQALALRSCLLLGAVAVLACWYYLAAQPGRAALFAVTCLASVLLLACYGLARRGAALAPLCWLCALTAAIVAYILAAGPQQAGPLLVLPVVLAGGLLRPALAPAWGALCALVGAVLPVQPKLPWLELCLLPAAGIATWLAMRPYRQLLSWSWQRAMEATALAEQLRDERSKLHSTIKSLDLSYQLLQQTNRELALARQEADALRDMRHRFATNLSHELRTPLNIIMGFTRLIYRQPQLYGYPAWNDRLMRDLAEIFANASYLSELVDDVVDLARMDALAMPIRKEETDLRKLAAETLDAVRSLAREKNLELKLDIPPELPTLSVDPQRIRQVLFNLLANAIRFTPAGFVRISAQVAPEEMVICVEDTGAGIPEADLEAIFDEFYQVGRPRGEANAGKGLGLAIAKRLVQLHGGRIWAQSQIGHGTRIYFALPLSPKAVVRVGQTKPLPLPEARLRPKVIVLDEDGTATPYLARRLEAYEFHRVESALELQQHLADGEPVAVIARHTGCGQGANARLLAAIPESTILIEASLPAARWFSDAEGCAAVLIKPISQEDVAAALRKANWDGQKPLDILLVDDDRGFVQLLGRMIEAVAGGKATIRSAYSGRAALAKMRARVPDLVFLDLLMPGMSGLELLGQMRKDHALSQLPVILVTAATPGEDELASEGAAFCVRRRGAFRPGELTALLETALSTAAGTPLAAGKEQALSAGVSVPAR